MRTGSFVAIVGQVGAGKSSLINAIMGELNKTQGRLAVKVSCGGSSCCSCWCYYCRSNSFGGGGGAGAGGEGKVCYGSSSSCSSSSSITHRVNHIIY